MHHPPSLLHQTSMTTSASNEITGRSPATYMQLARKQSLVQIHTNNANSEPNIKSSAAAQQLQHQQQAQQPQQQQQQQQQLHQSQQQLSQLMKPAQITKEVTTNQLKVKIYFGFNHSGFDSRIDLKDQIVNEFNVEMDNLIRLSYLTLTLKEIHENRKWNNLLYLKG
jgi:outer membrane protein OmpA-like peptidoglycan-associated protein